ncbi:hypothetical protein ACEQPO_17270 [Bacillus sp. SL00103]
MFTLRVKRGIENVHFMADQRFVVVDIETTEIHLKKGDKIIQILLRWSLKMDKLSNGIQNM